MFRTKTLKTRLLIPSTRTCTSLTFREKNTNFEVAISKFGLIFPDIFTLIYVFPSISQKHPKNEAKVFFSDFRTTW